MLVFWTFLILWLTRKGAAKRDDSVGRCNLVSACLSDRAMDLCLADGIPKSERREIVTNEGSSPFRMNDLLSKRGDAFQPSIFGQILKIILEEVMGIHTEVMRFEDFLPLPKHSSTFYQLTGCLPANIQLELGGNLTSEEFCDPSIALHASLGPRLSTTRQEIN